MHAKYIVCDFCLRQIARSSAGECKTHGQHGLHSQLVRAAHRCSGPLAAHTHTHSAQAADHIHYNNTCALAHVSIAARFRAINYARTRAHRKTTSASTMMSGGVADIGRPVRRSRTRVPSFEVGGRGAGRRSRPGFLGAAAQCWSHRCARDAADR